MPTSARTPCHNIGRCPYGFTITNRKSCTPENGSFRGTAYFFYSCSVRSADLCADRQAVIREDDLDVAVGHICRTDHAAALYAAQLCRFQICYQHDLLADEVFRFIPRCDARNHLSAAHAVIQLEL